MSKFQPQKSNSAKATYIPPHVRNSTQNTNRNETSNKIPSNKIPSNKIPSNKIKIDEFPALAPAPVKVQSSMDFKEIFARRRALRKREKKMKYGWVCLTQNGIIDSLTPEQREQSNLERNERRMEYAMINLAHRIERDTERRIEYEDLEPVILEDYSSEEYYESSEESYVDEDEEGYESK